MTEHNPVTEWRHWTEWRHCTPKLRHAGRVDCPTTPRRACDCKTGHGRGHDHVVHVAAQHHRDHVADRCAQLRTAVEELLAVLRDYGWVGR